MAKRTKKDLEKTIALLRQELEKLQSRERVLLYQAASAERTAGRLLSEAAHVRAPQTAWVDAHRQLACVLTDTRPALIDKANVPMRGRDGQPEEGIPHE